MYKCVTINTIDQTMILNTSDADEIHQANKEQNQHKQNDLF